MRCCFVWLLRDHSGSHSQQVAELSPEFDICDLSNMRKHESFKSPPKEAIDSKIQTEMITSSLEIFCLDPKFEMGPEKEIRHLSIHLFIRSSIYPFIYISVHLSTHSTNNDRGPAIHLALYQAFCFYRLSFLLLSLSFSH